MDKPWESLSLGAKLSILAGETLVSAYQLAEDAELLSLIQQGGAQEECIHHIAEHY